MQGSSPKADNNGIFIVKDKFKTKICFSNGIWYNSPTSWVGFPTLSRLDHRVGDTDKEHNSSLGLSNRGSFYCKIFMKRIPKKWVIYVLKYIQDNSENIIYKVWCSISRDWVKRRILEWNRILKMKWEVYAIRDVKDKYREEHNLISHLWETHRYHPRLSEVFFDVEEEIDLYLSNKFS